MAFGGKSNGKDTGRDEEAAASNEPRPNLSHWKSQHDVLVPHIPEALRSERELERLMAEFSEEDDVATKTWSRQLVEKHLIKRKFYNPQRDDDNPNKPDLTKAWAYYEHVTLARRFVTDETAAKTFERAEAGETDHTELYSAIFTPERALNEWGVGVGMYFSSVRCLAIILVVGGLISLPNIFFYRSEAYNGPGGQSELDFLVQGSMICTNREWVQCISGCEKSQYAATSLQEQWAQSVDGTTTFVKRTLCVGAELTQGMINYGALIFVAISIILLSLYQRKREQRFDEDKLTSTDYSIKVCNPPPDAVDPDTWRDFFEQFSEKQVTVVTVALNNEDLLQALVTRRIFRNKLRQILPDGIDLDNEEEVKREIDAHVVERESRNRGCLERLFWCCIVPVLRLPPFHMFHHVETLQEKIALWTSKIKELQGKKYDVSNVFVTFETEEGQRSALEALRVGSLDLARQNTRAVAPTALFKGRVLKVQIPAEPSATRWLHLTLSTRRKYIQRLVTLIITLGLIALSAFVINKARTLNSLFFSICVATFNFTIPFVIKLLLLLERHSNEGSRQRSMYLKITLFRWSNTAILTKLITPFRNTLGANRLDLLPSITGVLLAEMVFSPLLRLSDVVGFIRKHVLAPRAQNQELCNLCFTGTVYNLGERYTDLTKVVFLVFFYSALNPNAWFLGAVALFFHYNVDKICLTRLWAPSALIGPELARFNRLYFLTGALLAFAMVSSYAYAEFPYDKLCDYSGDNLGTTGSVSVEFFNGSVGEITVPETNSPVIFCEQKYSLIPGFHFPALPSAQEKSQGEWMSNSQALLVTIFGWTSLFALVTYLAVLFGNTAANIIMSIFGRGESATSQLDSKIDFSAVNEVSAYVPQIKAAGFLFPFLATDVDNVSDDLIGWHDTHHTYDEWNLIYDVPYEGMRRRKTNVDQSDSSTIASNPIFSIVSHYPPEWVKKKERENSSESRG